MSELALFTDGTEHIVARDLDDAKAIQRETTGIDRQTQDECEWDQELDDKPIWIWWKDGRASCPCDGGEKLELTAAEWVAKAGRGWLCSSEW